MSLNQLVRRQSIEPPTNGECIIDPAAFFDKKYISKLKHKTDGQRELLNTLDQSIITFCHGPSGTGKTYLAVGKSLEWLYNNQVKKIILCRPAVECGSRMGYLPGDESAKIEPYMRPLLDKLIKFIDEKEIKRLITDKLIEIEPLAYMRGRSEDDACLILDEAQNCKKAELLMFLTRLGENSRAIICGDTDQTDLRDDEAHAFHRYIYELGREPYVDGINEAELTEADIVRSKIVQQVVKKFGKL